MNSKSFKKVLLILPINSGTMAIRAYDLYFFLKKNNVNVAVAILKNSENPVFKFENEYIFESKVKSIFRIIVKTLWLKKIKNNFKPDISISVLNGCSIVNLLSGGNDFKIGMFRAPIEQLRDWNGEFHTTNFTYRFLFSRLDKLYCVSEGIRKSILENYPQIKKEKVETVYNLFDIEKIKLLGKEPIDIDFFDKYKVIVNIGRIEKIKEQERLIRAYSLLDDQTKKETKLVFIGDNKTEYFNEISQLVNDLNLNENILFLGEVKNPYKYISKSKIFVLSSIQEGLPGVLIEALILEVPVIQSTRPVSHSTASRYRAIFSASGCT
jgi:glycosyltransferase involved in cell wall biosynthesis